VQVCRSRARSTSQVEKQQACSDINSLLGLAKDAFGTKWAVTTAYDNISGELSAQTPFRTLTRLKEAAAAEIVAAQAISGCNTRLLCSPSVGQLVKNMGADTTSIAIGRVQKKVRLPQVLHAMQSNDDGGEDEGGSEEAQVMDESSTSSTCELDDVDIMFGVQLSSINQTSDSKKHQKRLTGFRNLVFET